MPLYTCNIDRSAGNQQGEFVLAITNLHVKTFGGDRDAVRVEFIIPGVEGTRYHYGGTGYKWGGFFSNIKFSDYLVANLDFRGTPEEWQAYCQEIVKIWIPGRKLQTVYLRKLEYEFEVTSENPLGKIVDSRHSGKANEAASEALPAYHEQS